MENNLPPLPPDSSSPAEPNELPVLEPMDWGGIPTDGSRDEDTCDGGDLADAGRPHGQAYASGTRRTSTPFGAVPIVAWRQLAEIELADPESDAATVCRIAITGAGRRVRRLSEAELDSLCAAVATTHRLSSGVGVDEDGSLLVLAPEGLPWSTLAATVEAVRASAGGRSGGTGIERSSIGMSDLDSDRPVLEDALRLSRLALAQALETRAPAALWTPADETRATREHTIVSELVDSLEQGQGFRLVFQPKFDTQTEEVVGAEGLLRHEPGPYGEISPSEFLPIAARAGILERLERWVVEEGVAAIAVWRSSNDLDLPISLNVRAAELLSETFVDDLRTILDRNAVEARLLRLEVSEADFLRYRGSAGMRLRELQELGVSIALDDFGRHGSTMTDLGSLPIDVLKVDRSLVAEMMTDDGASTLIRGVVSLANVLGIKTVAAGVETRGQLEKLRELGCNAVQGFLLSRPLELVEFDELLASRRSRNAA